MAATAAIAALFAPRINPAHHEILLVLTAVALGVATLTAIVTLMPSLKIGPLTMSLASWMSAGPKDRTSSALYDSKAIILDSNLDRLQTMRILFAVQAIATVCAVGLALLYTALR